MNSEIGTVLMHINGEWWKFRGMESIGWMICWSESDGRLLHAAAYRRGARAVEARC